MAESVIIEGSVTPAAGVLRRGEKRSVTMTPRIETLVKRGFVDIVGEAAYTPPPATPITPEAGMGTNQDLVQAEKPPVEANPITPEAPMGTDQGLVEANPTPDTSLVDNSLVSSTDPGTTLPGEAAATKTTRSTKK